MLNQGYHSPELWKCCAKFRIISGLFYLCIITNYRTAAELSLICHLTWAYSLHSRIASLVCAAKPLFVLTALKQWRSLLPHARRVKYSWI